jgi:DNA-binding NtrC family response regulator
MANVSAKVVFIESGAVDVRAAWEVPLALGTFALDRVRWAGAATAKTLPAGTGAVIAALTTDAGPMIDWLEGQRARIPVLALLPPDLPAEVGARATRVADDFVLSPPRWSEIELRLRRLMPAPPLTGPVASGRVVARRLACELADRNLVGSDPAFSKLVRDLPRVAASDATVLITGETGTGKELYARAIHHMGPRHDRPFVAVDCGAFPEQLLESELYGHAAGAFTDARAEHKGLARMAEGGTLFLDEVDALSLPAQGKLLRFLQERTFKPLGDERIREANVRILAATNRDLATLVSQQRFRADLFFRLGVLLVHIMPLRDRRSDIPILAAHFIERCTGATPERRLRFTPRALELLAHHDFPGNVRELFNLVQRAAVMIEGDEIDAADLTPPAAASAPAPRSEAPPAPRPAPMTSATFRDAKARAVEAFERSFVADLLARHDGNITRASREARKDRRAFGRLVKKHGLDPQAG